MARPCVCVALLLPALSLACRREDPRIRALTVQAAQADEAAQQLREAWSQQLRRFGRAGLRPVGPEPMWLTADQKRALEARVHREKDSSRRALLQEILEQDGQIQALDAHLTALKAALPAPEIAQPHDSHYGLALRFLLEQGQTVTQARKVLSQVALTDHLAPGFEVYHFYVHGTYGTWVSQGRASISPRELDRDEPPPDTVGRDAALARGRQLQRELALLEAQRKLIEQDIRAIQSERERFLAGQARLQSENAQQLARLNSLHYLVGVRDDLETRGIIELPLLGKDHSGPRWRDGIFTQHLDLRQGHTVLIRAAELNLPRITKVLVIPGSHRPDEHLRVTLAPDGQTATVELLTLDRFKNEKVVFAVVE